MRAFSSISNKFVSPLYPKEGERVSVKIALSERAERVILRYDSYTGLMKNEEMSFLEHKDNAYYYKGSFEVFKSKEDLSYFFVIFKDGEPLYYSNEGLTVYPPRYISRFIIKPSLDAPSWVSDVTCYQIFPDRFYNGDSSNDVKEGEYEFDGALVQAKEFDSIPEEFEKSRCLDFYNGDLKGVEEKLDYLANLAVTMIYLNPLFDSRTVHRYDAVDFFSIDKKLGGDEALISLVEKAHKKGIKIVLDISINHVGTDSAWYKSALNGGEEDEYFTHEEDGSIKFWQGVRTLADLNYNSEKLRDIIYRSEKSAMQKFIKAPFNIDGWRLDVAPEVARTKDYSLCLDLWRDVRSCLKSIKNDLYIVGEGWDDSTPYLNGDMWDATMNYYGSGRILRMMAGEEDRFLQAGWGYDPTSRRRIDAKEASRIFNSALNGMPDQMRHFQMNLIDSHDTPRLHNNYKIMDDDRYLSLVMILFFLPGFPSIYYGDEVKLDGSISSVEGCRYPMAWDESKQNKRYFEWHKALSEIRKRDGFGHSCYEIKAIGSVFYIARYLENESLIALYNTSEGEECFELDPFMLNLDNPTLILGRGEIDGLNIKLKGNTSAIFSFKTC